MLKERISYLRCVTGMVMFKYLDKSDRFIVCSSFHFVQAPMTALIEASDSPPNDGVIRCDTRYFCPNGYSCCKGSEGHWNCCPYPLVCTEHLSSGLIILDLELDHHILQIARSVGTVICKCSERYRGFR